MTKHKIFVYGALKQGFLYHNEYLGDGQALFIGKGAADREFSLFVPGMPYLVHRRAIKPAKGEIYLVDNEQLGRLDYFEGHPYVFKREIISVYDESGAEHLAWAYIHPNRFFGKEEMREEEYV